jgi:hypothetical protein
VGDVPAAAEVTEGKAEDEGHRVQGEARSRSLRALLIVDRWLGSHEGMDKEMYWRVLWKGGQAL